jgi:F420-non-reducing hydrogenase small subunit
MTAPAATKPLFAMYWAASCGGCDIAVLNLNEKLFDVAEAFDIVFWPCATDGKYADVEALPDGAITLTLFSGGIRNDENERLARLLRAKSKVLVAFGSCACEGCIPGLANLKPLEALLDIVYEGPSTDNPEHLRPVPRFEAPEGILVLPALLPTLRTLDQVVPVDYYVPGCPPETDRIAEVVGLVLDHLAGNAELPPLGSVLGGGHSTVCDECPRTRNVKRISRFTRIQDLPSVDPTLCLLEQGIPCNGPATRDGCGALCPTAGAQCIGCYGPADGVVDYGARLLSAFASVVDSDDPEQISSILDGIPDPVGQIYRFSLAGSLLGGARSAWQPDGAPSTERPVDASIEPDREPVAAGAT